MYMHNVCHYVLVNLFVVYACTHCRLAHLLETKPGMVPDKPTLSYDPSEKKPAINKKLDQIFIPTPGSVHIIDTQENIDPSDQVGSNHQRNPTDHEETPSPLAGIKRSSSNRDDHGEIVQLQEADSTVADPNPIQESTVLASQVCLWEKQTVLRTKHGLRHLSVTSDTTDNDADVLTALMDSYESTKPPTMTTEGSQPPSTSTTSTVFTTVSRPVKAICNKASMLDIETSSEQQRAVCGGHIENTVVFDEKQKGDEYMQCDEKAGSKIEG